MPIGCQTVFVSRKESSRPVPGAAVQSWADGSAAGRTTRFNVSAAAASRAAAAPGPSGAIAPARSSALTSWCEASVGARSAVRPESRLTTPPGTSEVASTSPSDSAGSGARSAAATTTVLPVAIAGATTDTRPSSEKPYPACGASTPTTPVGSGVDRLKNGPATGLAPPATCATLSVQPAYQTQRSTAASTSAAAFFAPTPSAAATSAANCSRRPSSISATRYSTWPRLYAVVPAQPLTAARAASTASRASLRVPSGAFASHWSFVSVTSYTRPLSERGNFPPTYSL